MYTIGVYGWTPERFVDTLKSANVTALVDIRRRRGVRGPVYRFANAMALENLMRSNGIGYVSELRLAPTNEIRSLQKDADKRSQTLKADRTGLAPAFVQAYEEVVLGGYSRQDANELLRVSGGQPALLCVERYENACHRSLAAEFLAALTGANVSHLRP